jgi:magnesium and cobalt exporter, CNNM family
MSEIAVVSARKARLRQMADTGDRGARSALALTQNPTRFLSTVQIGIMLVGILAGAFGGATMAEQINITLGQNAVLAPYSVAIGLAVVVTITILSLSVGELVPKRLALNNPERNASRVVGAMMILARQRIVWRGWTFEVVDMDGRRVDKLRAMQTVAPAELHYRGE